MKDCFQFSKLVILCAVATANAQFGGGYIITNSTVDSGGGTVTGGDYQLSGTVGQHDAKDLEDGDYAITSGFWFATQLGDCNGNGIRDLGDHQEFVECMSGPAIVALGACRCFDTSGDEDVDLLDFAQIQRAYFSG